MVSVPVPTFTAEQQSRAVVIRGLVIPENQKHNALSEIIAPIISHIGVSAEFLSNSGTRVYSPFTFRRNPHITLVPMDSTVTDLILFAKKKLHEHSMKNIYIEMWKSKEQLQVKHVYRHMQKLTHENELQKKRITRISSKPP